METQRETVIMPAGVLPAKYKTWGAMLADVVFTLKQYNIKFDDAYEVKYQEFGGAEELRGITFVYCWKLGELKAMVLDELLGMIPEDPMIKWTELKPLMDYLKTTHLK